VTGPIQGRYTLRCNSCQAVVYSSDDGPPDDRATELTRFADTQCPRGGVAGNCPNVSTIREVVAKERPRRMRILMEELQALAESLRPIATGAEAEHRALWDARDELSARIEQVAARGEQIGDRVEQVAATHTGQIDTHTGQLTTHDGQIATHDAQLATLTGQVNTVVSQMAVLLARQPVVRLSRDQPFAALSTGATRTVTFTWPTSMPNTSYEVSPVDERLVIAATASKTTAAVTVTVRATVAITVTTIAALAVGWT
jgi:hypothetical protein